MRQIKSFILLSAVSFLLLAVLFFSGALNHIVSLWRNIIQANSLAAVGPQVVVPMALVLNMSTVWVGLRAGRREFFFLSLATFALLLGASLEADLYRSFLSPVEWIAAVVLGVISVFIFRKTEVGSREPALRRLFAQRLRPDSLRRLVDGNLSIDFPGELHDASVLVCSVHNHVDLMEMLAPSDYVSLMNLYLRAASDFLVDAGGYLDECSGESIRVIFGVPLKVEGAENHASKAARTAIDLVSRLEELNHECDARWQKRLDFRIGVNSGAMIAAAYGGTLLGRYSVSGPVVEFARHLSAACAQYGCRILAGPLTYEMSSGKMEGRPIDLLQRVGSRRRVEIYEFLAPKNFLSPEKERSRDQFWKGVIFFRERKWDEALRAFSSARIPGIPDKALDHYLERIERARRGEDDPTPEQALLAEAVS